jgi:hypothetical protein
MNYSLALAAAVAAFSWMQITGAAAQSVYVAPGGVYVAPGAGPVYVTPPGPINRPAAYVGPGAAYPGAAYRGTVGYVESDYDDGYAPVAYVEPRYGYGYGPDVYVEPRYGYGYGSRPYLVPRYGYGYRSAAPYRRYDSGPRGAYAAALPARPRVSVPYRSGRCVGRYC